MSAADIDIAEAAPGDVEALSAFAIKTYVDAFGAGFARPEDLAYHLETSLSEARWRNYLDRDRVLLARIGGALAGYVQFGPSEVAEEGEIERLYVDRPWQGQGIGRRLLSLAIDRLEAAGMAAIWIGVWQDNDGARRLYESFGFEAAGRKAFVLQSGEIDGYDIRMVRRTAARGG